jgi:hypothetical protein
MEQQVKATCHRSLSSWDRTGCGVVHFYAGETYLFNVCEKVEGSFIYKEYSISLPQEGIIGNQTREIHFFDRHFKYSYFFDDYFRINL